MHNWPPAGSGSSPACARTSQIAPERAYPSFLRGNEPWMAEGDEHADAVPGSRDQPGPGAGAGGHRALPGRFRQDSAR